MKGNDMQCNPWKGLVAYGVDDSKLFYGRDNDINTLQTLIEYDQVVTLYGKSGIGKTSLLCAGVVPNLLDGGYVTRIIRLGLSDKAETYAEIILSQLLGCDIDTDCTIKDIFVKYFCDNPTHNSYGEICGAVVILDQFEEILSKDSAKVSLLLQQLAEWKRCDKNILFDCHFVLSIREDDLYLLEDVIDKRRLNSLRSSRYRLNDVTLHGAKEIILRPGKEYIKNEDVVDRILSLLRDDGSDQANCVYKVSALSLICSQLYMAMCNSQQQFITLELVNQYGQKSIIDYYKSAANHLSFRSITAIEKEFITENGRRSLMSIDRFNKLFH